jgi:hypothetical protein
MAKCRIYITLCVLNTTQISTEQGEQNTMKTPRIYIGALAVFCLFALVLGTASSAAMTQQGNGTSPRNGAGQFGPEKMLDNLIAQGYDVSTIRAAVTNGDYETAHTLMQEFRTAHPDALPVRGEGAGKGPMTGEKNGERMLLMLDNLTEQGFEVSAIRTAATSGNYESAHTLMQEFRTAHPDAFPATGERAGKYHMGGQRCAKESSVT